MLRTSKLMNAKKLNAQNKGKNEWYEKAFMNAKNNH